MRLSSLFSLIVIVPSLVVGPTLLAQRGDRKGHDMKPPPEHWKIPAAPVLTADRALKSFAVEEGFRVELVAAEPMIHDPVALAFDGNGRIWVAEMRGFMPNIDGKGEHDPVGRISVLEDTDGDGKIDRNSVFLDEIVLPRTVAFADADRTLVYADDFDLYEVAIKEVEGGLPKAGESKIIDKGFSKGGNPEHKPNGMRYALDNWYYNAKSDQRFRKVDGKWEKEKVEFRGQWGIDQDDYGRLFTNTNSNFVTGESLSPGLKSRNPNHQFRVSGDVRLKNQATWPARINPGINRGYLDGFLDDEGYLRRPTAVSGLAVYRGDQFPAEYYGNLFLNEPGGNLVKRAVVKENEKGEFTIEPAYEGKEFFTSTDERSRIVHSFTAPDGTLYLVDLYRGILQHGAYVTTFLRKQILERGLDKPVGLGRIWRVAHEGKDLSPQPKLIAASNEEIAKHLAHPNGFWRDTAQRLLVQGGDEKAVGPVRKILKESEDPKAKIHALWTLEGLGELTPEDVAVGLKSDDPHAVAQAIRASESLARTDHAAATVVQLKSVTGNESPIVLRQLLATLGTFHQEPEALSNLARLYVDAGGEKLTQDLALSGLSGSEDDFLESVLNTRNELKKVGSVVVINSPEDVGLAAEPEKSMTIPIVLAIAKSKDGESINSLQNLALRVPRLHWEVAYAAVVTRSPNLIKSQLGFAADTGFDEIRSTIVEGMLAGRKSAGSKYKPISLGKELPTLIAKAGLIPPEQNIELAKLFDFSGGVKTTYLKSDADKKQFSGGQKHYERICMACHQPHGRGQEFIAPPLVDSEWVTGPEKRLIALVMDGMIGPVTVDGKKYDAPEIQPMMPGLRVNPEVNDDQLSAILSYVRNAWGNAAPVVKTETVKKFRESNPLRAPYTEKDLKDVK